MAYTIRKSVVGNQFGLNSTGALVDKNGYGALMKNSTGAIQSSSSALSFAGTLVVDEAFSPKFEVASSSGATVSAYGITIISSGTAAALNLVMADPSTVPSLKHVFAGACSATTVLLKTTSTATVFMSTQDVGATGLQFEVAGGVMGESVVLHGITVASGSPRWAVLYRTGGVTLVT